MIVQAWLSRAARSAPDALAIECGDGSLSYAGLLASAQAGADQLSGRGVGAGDLVAIELGPGIAFAQALHACWLLGASAMPLDVRMPASERAALAKGAAAVVGEPLGEAAGGASNAAGTASSAAGGPSTVGGGARGERAPTHDLDSVAVVLHTSGTTSAPKRVQITFGNLLWSALGSAVALGADPGERWLCTLPVCHVGGLSILVRSAIFGTTAVVHERFETGRALTALMEQGITLVSVVATTLSRLLDAGLTHPPALRCALAGGGPVPPALLQRAAGAGVTVSQTYGLTEACSQVSTVPVAALGAAGAALGAAGAAPRAASAAGAAPAGRFAAAEDLGAGRPLFCTKVEIAPDGEILVSGPTVARGAAEQDGRLHTGDLGRIDEDGNLHVTGRKADTIVSGGENVAPAEVEAVLEAHPDVVEAAVVGRSHPEWGEAVTAIVVPREGADLDPGELRAHCAATLAPFKVPKELVLVSQPLPRTRSGKLLRREIA